VSDDRSRSVVENSPYGIYRISSDGRFVAVNRALCAMVGYTECELAQSNVALLDSESSQQRPVPADVAMRSDGVPVEAQWRRKNGEAIAVRIWAYGEREERGVLQGVDGYVENITPLRAAEQALRQAEKLAALGELVSGVAHQLNNPLSAILLFSEDLLLNERRAEEREALGIIAQQARRSRAIVRDLLSFARSRDAVREPVESRPFFDQLVRTLAPQLEEQGVSLHAMIDDESIVLPIDRAGIEQVITNLVINGAQAAGVGGTVCLHAGRDGAQFVIEVLDDGHGIPADAFPRIFEPFFTTKPMGQGTGLGLSVSRGVVEQHGGRIVARNRVDVDGDRGALFTVRLPLPSRAEAVVDSATDPAPCPEGAHRVLIVDDEATIRQALTRFYQRRGWVVTQAEDGAHAFERLIASCEPFDLVISDMKMPGVSGMELHAALREVRPDLVDRVLFCTGEVDSATVSAFVADTHCHVLVKPFDLRALASLSDDIVARKAPRIAS
jgi:PAS domain S-box-containing protein